jgi:hypothetical protein
VAVTVPDAAAQDVSATSSEPDGGENEAVARAALEVLRDTVAGWEASSVIATDHPRTRQQVLMVWDWLADQLASVW